MAIPLKDMPSEAARDVREMPRSVTVPARARTHALFWIAMVLLVCLVTEAAARVIEMASPRVLVEAVRPRAEILREQSERIALLLDSQREGREQLDPRLGWTYRAGFASPTDHINGQGVRALQEYARTAAANTLRVAAFGDSFVYGNEVADADAWCSVLESGTSDLEVLNYGVGGYGLDQAYLRYRREGMALHPHVVLIGFTPDDLRRVVNVYRRFVSTQEWPLTKPRFVLQDDGALVLIPNPLATRADYARLMAEPASVRALGAQDQWYDAAIYDNALYDAAATVRVGHAVWRRVHRRWFDGNRLMRGELFNERSTAFRLQVAILRAFSDAVRADAAIPVVLMLPNRSSVEQVLRGSPAEYAPLSDALGREGIVVWDGMHAFHGISGPVDSLFAPGGHYSPAGNRAIARWLAGPLDSLRLARLPHRT